MRFFLGIVCTGLIVWAIALGIYLARMNAPADAPQTRADALIVLTGSPGRIERGLELLADGSAPVLLISGVGKGTSVQDMLNLHATPQIRQRIVQNGGKVILDAVASTTQTNASESARFIHSYGYHSVRLITAQYHMPRSMMEFHHALPDATIYKEPVSEDDFVGPHWWRNTFTCAIVMQEFHKFMAAGLRLFIQQIDD